MKKLLLLSILLIIGAVAIRANTVTCIKELAGPNNCYKLYEPKGKARGLVVLLPGFGDTIEFYDQYKFPQIMQRRGYLVANISMAGYLVESEVKTLLTLISEITKKHNIPPNKLTIGGFSAGGVGAVRYGEYCVEQKCSDTTKASAVFTVDAPLDLERWWNCSVRQINRKPGDSDGWRGIQGALLGIFGGPPTEKRDAYLKVAPLTVTEPNGGNVRFLKDIPVRAYSEPDISWTIKNRGQDYYCHNSIDQAALILELEILGNKNAEYITTSGKGYRAEFVQSTGKYRKGERSPHSWMMVDELNLANWIVKHTK